MNKIIFRPEQLFPSEPLCFSQVISTKCSELIFCSGQISIDKNSNLIGVGDLSKQLNTCFDNIGIALGAAGAEMKDVLQIRIYIVNYDPSMWDAVHGILNKFFDSESGYPASTLIGVSALVHPDVLCEVEAIASSRG